LFFDIERTITEAEGAARAVVYRSSAPYYLAPHLEDIDAHGLAGFEIPIPPESFVLLSGPGAKPEPSVCGSQEGLYPPMFTHLGGFLKGDRVTVRYVVGGGGGHEINVHKLRVTVVVEPSRFIARLQQDDRDQARHLVRDKLGFGNITLCTYAQEFLSPHPLEAPYERFTKDESLIRGHIEINWLDYENRLVTFRNMNAVFDRVPTRTYFAIDQMDGTFAPWFKPTIFELVDCGLIQESANVAWITSRWFKIKKAGSSVYLRRKVENVASLVAEPIVQLAACNCPQQQVQDEDLLFRFVV
jgi:hypothetical protein